MLTTGEAIGVLRAIEHKVWGYDIPSPCCPEYREHHVACMDILEYIRGYIELIKKYDGIPSIADMYPTRVTMYIDSDPVPLDPDDLAPASEVEGSDE